MRLCVGLQDVWCVCILDLVISERVSCGFHNMLNYSWSALLLRLVTVQDVSWWLFLYINLVCVSLNVSVYCTVHSNIWGTRLISNQSLNGFCSPGIHWPVVPYLGGPSTSGVDDSLNGTILGLFIVQYCQRCLICQWLVFIWIRGKVWRLFPCPCKMFIIFNDTFLLSTKHSQVWKFCFLCKITRTSIKLGANNVPI